MPELGSEKLFHLANPAGDIAHFEISREFQNVALPALIGVITGGTLATAALAFEWPVVIFALFGFAFVVSIVLLLVHVRTLERARTAVDILIEEWRTNQEQLRANSRERLQMEIRVNKGGTLNWQPTTTHQTLVLEDGISARAFTNYFREFLQRAEFMKSIGDGETGMERDRWLGQGKPFQFNDGTPINRPLYELLIDHAKVAGLLAGRAKGTAGQSKIAPGTRAPSQPSQANQEFKVIGDER